MNIRQPRYPPHRHRSGGPHPAMTSQLIDRKQHLLQQEMGRHPKDIMGLAGSGLLNNRAWRAIQDQASGPRRAASFVDLFMKDFKDEDYQALADALMGIDVLSYLGDELDLEAAVERGEVKPTQRMDEDAKMVVHRCFGTSRRHTENEKKKIHAIIARRLVVLYQANERHLQRLNDGIEAEREKGEDLEDRILKLTTILQEYNECQHEERIAFNLEAGDSKDPRNRMLTPFDEHAHETGRTIEFANALCLAVEKERNALNILKARLDEKHVEKPLDEGLEAQLEELLRALAAENHKLEKEGRRVERLTQDMDSLKLLRRKELSIVRQKGQESRGLNDNTLGQLIAFSNEQGWLRDELLTVLKEIDIWKWRCECLEHGQDLNSLYRKKKRYRPVYTSYDDLSVASSPTTSLSSTRTSPYPLHLSASTNSLSTLAGPDSNGEATPLQKMVTRLRLYRYMQAANSPRSPKKLFQL